MKRVWRHPWVSWILRLGFAALLLVVLLLRIDLLQILRTLSNANLVLLGSSLSLRFLIDYILAYQLWLGSAAQSLAVSVPDVFEIRLVATFYGLVLPGSLPAGAITWYRLSRAGRRMIEAGAVVIYFRVVDTLTLLGVGVIATWFDPRLGSPQLRVLLGVMSIAVATSLLLFVSPPATQFLEWSVGRLALRWHVPEWADARRRRVWQAVKAFQRLPARTVGLILGLSLLSHALGILKFHALALAVGIRLPMYVVGWVRSVLIIVQMIPVSVAGLGVREASSVALLRQYGIHEAQALSFSLLIFAQTVVVGMLGGLLELCGVLGHRTPAEP